MHETVRAIESFKEVHLLFVQYQPAHRDALIDALNKSGTVSKIYEEHETPIYQYKKQRLEWPPRPAEAL